MARGASPAFEALCAAPPRVTARAMLAGKGPAMDSIAGWEFRAWCAPPSLPSVVLGKHRKGFYALGRGGGALGGYVIPCRGGGGPGGRWIDRLRGPGAARLAWFLAGPAGGGRYPGAVLLDYGRAGKVPGWSPLAGLREYLVQPWDDDPDVLVSAIEFRAGSQARHLGTCVLVRDRQGTVGL